MIGYDKKETLFYRVRRLHIGRLVFGLFNHAFSGDRDWNDLERYVEHRPYLDGSWHFRILWFAVGWKTK